MRDEVIIKIVMALKKHYKTASLPIKLPYYLERSAYDIHDDGVVVIERVRLQPGYYNVYIREGEELHHVASILYPVGWIDPNRIAKIVKQVIEGERA